jgi:hypothetical protein
VLFGILQGELGLTPEAVDLCLLGRGEADVAVSSWSSVHNGSFDF